MDARQYVLVIFTVSVCAMLTCGTQYGLSAWSPQLKVLLNCSQSDIELVGEIGNMGPYLGPLTGSLTYLFPEWVCASISASFALLGYVAMALIVRSKPGESLHVLRTPTALGTCFAFAGFACGLLYNLLLVVNLQNLPAHRRGAGVAILATCVGLSASIFTFIYNGPINSNVSHFLLFMGIASILAALATGLFVRRVELLSSWGPDEPAILSPSALVVPSRNATTHQDELREPLHSPITMDSSSSSSSSAAAYRPVHVADDDESESPPLGISLQVSPQPGLATHRKLSSSRGGSNGTRVISTSPFEQPSVLHEDGLLLVPAPLFPASAAQDDSPSSRSAGRGGVGGGEGAQPSEGRLYAVSEAEVAQLAVQARTCGGGMAGRVFGSILFLVTQKSYWLTLSTFFLIAGVGLMQINNTGHVVQSLNGGVQDKDLTTLLILALSLSNGAGRLLMGLSDFTPVRKGYYLVAVSLLMSLTHFLSAWVFHSKDLVLLGVIGVGLAYGGLWSIMPILISDAWGAKSFSLNLGWNSFVSGLGGMFFNHWAGVLYDARTAEGDINCVGAKCYTDAFALCGAASLLATILAILLVPYTLHGRKRVAKKDIY